MSSQNISITRVDFTHSMFGINSSQEAVDESRQYDVENRQVDLPYQRW